MCANQRPSMTPVPSRRAFLLASLALGVSAVGLLIGLVANVASSRPRWPGALDYLRTHPWHSLVALLAATAALGITGILLEHHRGDPARGDMTPGEIADQLAIAVHRQWAAEAAWRQLNDPYAMSVRWEPADPALVAEWRTIVTLAKSGPGWPAASPSKKWASRPSRLAGSGNELIDVLAKIPTGRLVLLGEPGTGKSILLVRLLLDILSRRQSGDPVPVLLPLASWNPHEEALSRWITRMLSIDNPGLAAPVSGGARTSRAQALLEQGLFVLILDGLDEIPESVRGPAIARINDALRPATRLVVSSRTDAFRAAVRAGQTAVQIAGAPGVQLCSLDATVVSHYLKDSAGGPASAARWDNVMASFNMRPLPAVAQALTTPLMVMLARTIYNPRPGEELSAIPHQPSELLDTAGFPTVTSIQNHLFDGFVAATYRPHPDPARHGKWTPAQAERFLHFLAVDLEARQRGTTDLAWWKLADAAPRNLAGLSVGTIAGLAALIGYSFPIGVGAGLILTMAVGLSATKAFGSSPSSISRGLAGGMAGGLLGVFVAILTFGSGPGHSNRVGPYLAGGVAFAIASAPMRRFMSAALGAGAGALGSRVVESLFGYATGSTAQVVNAVGLGLTAAVTVTIASRGTPAKGLRWTRLGFIAGFASGAVIGLVAYIQAGLPGAIVVGLAGVIGGSLTGGLIEATPTDLTGAAVPRQVLRRDRATFAACFWGVGLSTAVSTGLAVALSVDVSTGRTNGPMVGIGVGTANLMAVGLAFGFVQSTWGSYVLARLWLAAKHALPLRLMAFLEDAHMTRGVLRQAGSTYQFRHLELQRRLAATAVP